MRLPPLIASLTRHKLTVALLLLATAFTCAIVVNIAFLLEQRLELLNTKSGLDESTVVMIDSSRIDSAGFDSGATHRDSLPEYRADLVALRDIQGVESATTAFGLPLSGGMGFEISSSANTQPGHGFQATLFFGGPGELTALGLHLVQGRDFLSSEYIPLAGFSGIGQVSAAVLSRTLAERLFHADDVVGRLFYMSGHPIRIVGVVDHLLGTSPRLGATDNEYAMLLPLEPDGDYTTFVLRTSPSDREQVLQQAIEVLGQRDPQRILDNATTFAHTRTKYFRRDGAMIGLLLAAGFGLLIVTAAGIAGLAGFWVQQRTRSIGIRRALGARRADILRYFHVENFLIMTLGALLGCLLAYVLNLLLMKYYSVQLLPPVYLAAGALALWLIGQIAVFGPALRASAVPPAVATRSV